MKKNNEVRKRHKIFKKTARPLLGLVSKIKYKYRYKKHKELKSGAPYLILGNHTAPFDPILMSISFDFPIYFFATEQIFNLGFISKVLLYLVNPIKKSKAISDLAAIRKTRQIVKEGGSIGIYPEGNVSYNGETQSMNSSIVKLVRLLKIPVIIFKTRGMYLTNPRWAIQTKKGQTEGYVDKIITFDEYKNLTDLELETLLVSALYVNAYDDQKEKEETYSGKDLALGLERLIFMDLKVNKPFITYTKGNELLSSGSDFKLTYLENGYVIWDDNQYDLVKLDYLVKESYIKYVLASEESFLYKEFIKVDRTYESYRAKLGVAEIELHKDKLIFNSLKETFIVKFEDIQNIAIQGKNKIIMYINDETYLMELNEHSSPYKYLITYQIHHEQITTGGTYDVSKFGL